MPPVDFTQYNSVFSAGGIAVSWTPQNGSGVQTIQAMPVPPGMPEELMGGQGTAVLRLWVDFQALSPAPAEGDVFSVSGVSYVLGRVEAETELTGGAVLKLRKQ